MSEFAITIESGTSKRLPVGNKWSEKDIIVTAIAGTDIPKYKKVLLYLESTGTQWLDLGTTVNTSTDEIKLYFQLTETAVYKWFFGEYDTNARLGLGSGDGANKRNFLYYSSAVKVSDSDLYDKQHEYLINSSGGFIDGVQKASHISFASTSTLYLFNINISGTSDYKCKARVWGYQQTRNGVLIRDLIPVLDWNDIPCMYDKVNDEFLYNQGTGEFLYESADYQRAEGLDEFPKNEYLIYGETLTAITDKMRDLTPYNGDINEDDPIKPEKIPEMLPLIRQDGYDEGYEKGQTEGLEALDALCEWSIMSNSQSYPIVTIINRHPSYYLHCEIYGVNADGDDWYNELAVPPDDSVSETFPFQMNAEAYIDVYSVRWRNSEAP